LSIDKEFPPNLSNLSNTNFPATEDDILREIKTTNAILRQMMNVMTEIRSDLKHYNKLLDENYNKMAKTQK
jgi:hypothetical protein